jgi:hypothetical protein
LRPCHAGNSAARWVIVRRVVQHIHRFLQPDYDTMVSATRQLI